MAHMTNGRDSQPKSLGVKTFAGENVKAGNIILKQRGMGFKAGRNVGVSKDYSLYALADGRVKYDPRRVVSVIPKTK
jgi:large subunit ribosomal protein L27